MKHDLKVMSVYLDEKGKQVRFKVATGDNNNPLIEIDRRMMLNAVQSGHKFSNASISKNGVIRVSKDVPRIPAPKEELFKFSLENNNITVKVCLNKHKKNSIPNTRAEIGFSGVYKKIVSGSVQYKNLNNRYTGGLARTVVDIANKSHLDYFEFLSNDFALGNMKEQDYFDNVEGLLLTYNDSNSNSRLAALKYRCDYIIEWVKKTGYIAPDCLYMLLNGNFYGKEFFEVPYKNILDYYDDAHHTSHVDFRYSTHKVAYWYLYGFLSMTPNNDKFVRLFVTEDISCYYILVDFFKELKRLVP